nr:MAG: DNA pilot protein [Microviridae sp.]
MGSTTQAGNLGNQLGSSVLGSIVGEGVGLLFAGANNSNQLNQQNALDQLQLQYNEEQTAYNYGQQLQLWQETNYPAQVQELQEAGLNPALLYGKGGGGGATVGSPSSNITGAQAPTTSIGQTAGLAIQSQEAQADINLKNAEAANLEAQTPQEAGLMQAQTASITQGVENQKAQQALIEMQTTAENLNNIITGNTTEDQIAQIRAAATQMENTANMAVRNNYIDQATMDTKIKQIQGEMIGTYITNTLKQTQTALTQEQITQYQNQIQQGWQQININKQNANTQQGQLQLQQLIKDIPDSEHTILQGLTRLIPNIMF